MTLKIKNYRTICGVIGIIGYIIGIISVKGFISAGYASKDFFMTPFSFSVSDFSLHVSGWADIICNSTLFILLIFVIGFSAIGFVFILPVIYYKMHALGFTSGIFYWLYGAKGLLYILMMVPCGIIVFFLMTACGGIALRFSLYILNKLCLFKKDQSQYITEENTIKFSNYIQSGIIFVTLSFVLPLYEGFVLPYLFKLIS